MTDSVIPLKELCEQAAEIVDSADISDAYRVVAFGRVIDALIEHGESPSTPRALQGDVTVLEKIAHRARVPAERIGEVFSYDNGELVTVASSRSIDSSAAQGGRELTLLIAGGRQAADLEDWTPLAVARDVCARYSRYDSGNYATNLRAMDRLVSFRGSGADREVRLTMPGWDAWSELVRRCLGIEEGE